jgi:hypothetical protein
MAIVYNADGEAGKVCNKCGEWKPVILFPLTRIWKRWKSNNASN